MDKDRLDQLQALGGDIAALVAEVKRLRDGECKATVPPESPLRLGNKVFIRAVTHYYTGRIVAISEHEVLLNDAAWVADTGRFSDALANGSLNEVEPFPGVVAVGRGAIVDVHDWSHQLPRVKK